jgi:hypothetical protein
MTFDNYTQQEIKRDFRGLWIPREIWFHPHLTLLEKSLWAEIYSLYDRERKGCYASNEYLAKFFNCSDRHIRASLANLKKYNLLEDVSFNGRQRVIRALQPEQDDRSYSEIYNQTGSLVPSREEENFRHGRKCTSGPSYYIEQSIEQREEYIAKNKKKKESSASPPQRSASDEASLLFDFFNSELEKNFPKAKKILKNEAQLKHFQDLLDRKDPKTKKPSFTVQEIKKIISYAFAGYWAPENINAPSKLKKHFDKVYMAMSKKPMIPKQSVSTFERNRTFFRKWYDEYKETLIEYDIEAYEAGDHVYINNKSFNFNSETFQTDVNKEIQAIK